MSTTDDLRFKSVFYSSTVNKLVEKYSNAVMACAAMGARQLRSVAAAMDMHLMADKDAHPLLRAHQCRAEAEKYMLRSWTQRRAMLRLAQLANRRLTELSDFNKRQQSAINELTRSLPLELLHDEPKTPVSA